jgi:hypothetical protein
MYLLINPQFKTINRINLINKIHKVRIYKAQTRIIIKFNNLIK